ncbi:MAG: hypothetical protein Q9214_001802 [Letrouitia sp. 1 TL-2023]
MLRKPIFASSSYASIHSFYCLHQNSVNVQNPQRPRSKILVRSWKRYETARRGLATTRRGKSSSEELDGLHWPQSDLEVPTPYQIFHLQKAAPYSKRRFYELVKLYHPDRHYVECKITSVNSLPSEVKLKRYRLVIAANDILSDPTKRRAYDACGAGWNGHLDVGKSQQPRYNRNGKTKPRWSGFNDNSSPAGNATWEDWEQWYQRDTEKPQTPVYFSNEGFFSLVALFVTLGAVFQANNIEGYQTSYARKIGDNTAECGRNIRERKERTIECGGGEVAIRNFLKSRNEYMSATDEIHPPNKEDTGTNTYLIGTGQQRLLIDTGEGRPSWRKLLSSVLVSESCNVSQVILTHWHLDHVGGVKDLTELCPDARIHKYDPGVGQEPIEDGQIFRVEGAQLRAVHCPGHTVDHMALVLKEEDAMFTGDNVLGHGTAVFEDLELYLRSLERMRGEFSGRAYPGHSTVIDDGRRRILDYIEHRQQREREVISVLGHAREAESAGSGKTPMELVKAIYKDVPENLHEPAAGGVLQILLKLSRERKVVQRESDGRWSLVEQIQSDDNVSSSKLV